MVNTIHCISALSRRLWCIRKADELFKSTERVPNKLTYLLPIPELILPIYYHHPSSNHYIEPRSNAHLPNRVALPSRKNLHIACYCRKILRCINGANELFNINNITYANGIAHNMEWWYSNFLHFSLLNVPMPERYRYLFCQKLFIRIYFRLWELMPYD